MGKRFSSNEAGTFFTAILLLTLATWQISFNLGAYGEIFFQTTLTIWIVSVAALFGSLVIGRTEDGEVYATWWGMVLLLLPSLLMTSVLWADAVPWLVTPLEWGTLLSIPYIAFILVSVSAREALEIQDRRLFVWLVIGFVSLNLLSYVAGLNNAAFMTCDDFVRAGDEAPSTCWESGQS